MATISSQREINNYLGCTRTTIGKISRRREFISQLCSNEREKDQIKSIGTKS